MAIPHNIVMMHSGPVQLQIFVWLRCNNIMFISVPKLKPGKCDAPAWRRTRQQVLVIRWHTS